MGEKGTEDRVGRNDLPMKACSFAVFLLILFTACQSASRKDISMYDVGNEARADDQARNEREMMQSAPPARSKEYSPVETVGIAGFGFVGLVSQLAYVHIKEKEKVGPGSRAWSLVPTSDPLTIEAEAALPAERKLPLCVLNINCSEELIKDNTSEKAFFSIELPGLIP